MFLFYINSNFELCNNNYYSFFQNQIWKFEIEISISMEYNLSISIDLIFIFKLFGGGGGKWIRKCFDLTWKWTDGIWKLI